MIEEAARQGVGPPRALWRMTPRELELALEAERRRQARALEWADALAWLTGGYAALGVRAPRRYPRRPSGAGERRTMTDEEMKRAALEFAARWKEGEGDGGDA